MKRRNLHTRSERAWRHGRFTLVRLPAPREEDAAFPREAWGAVDTVLRAPAHVHYDLICVPEGAALTARCMVCGGRSEALVDVRTLRRMENSEEALRRAIPAILDRLVSQWAPEHLACPTTPRQHSTPEVIQDFLRMVEHEARKRLAAGEEVLGVLHLLDAQGRVFSFAMGDLPPSCPGSTERSNEIAARHFSIREMVRARKLDLLAAVCVAECWHVEAQEATAQDLRYPSRSPRRRESLVLGMVTPTFQQGGLAFIERRSGRIGEGPGEVAPFTWVHTAESTVLDTLFATTAVLPQSEAEQRRGAGIDLRRRT